MSTLPRDTKPGDPLTVRELQVLELVAAGRGNAGTGRDLYMAEDTVKTHLKVIFAKLGARDRSHAVARAFQHGYLWIGHDQQVHAGWPRTYRPVA